MLETKTARLPRGATLAAAAPTIFVLLWSTGFIGAKFGLPYAEPFTFLTLRFAIVIVLMAGLACVIGAPWPRSPAAVGHLLVAGLLIHGAYLGGVFSAIHQGMPSGIASLLVGLQPLLTAVLAQPLLGERVTSRQWLGLLLGFVGVGMVVGEKLLAGGVGQPLTVGALLAATIALLGTTFGTMYQKRFCAGMQLTTGTTVQYVGAGGATLLCALLFETRQVRWTEQFIFALLWLVIVLSLGAILLLMYLIRQNSTARVTSLFYLVPPATALEAFALFGERLGALALVGMAVAIGGVALVVAPPKAGTAP